MAKKVPITKVLSCFFVIVFLMSSFSVAVIASDSSNSTVSNVTDTANSSVESVALSNNITDLTCRDDLIYINKTETVVNESGNSDLPVLNDTVISTAKTVSSLGYCSHVWIEITDKYCKGYEVYVDGVYQFTEGEDSVPDGYCRFKVTPGYHTFKLTLNGKEVSKGWNCQCGTGYNWMSMNDMIPHWCEGGGNDNPTDEYEVKFRGTVTSTTPSEYDCGFTDVYICEVKIEKVVSGDYFEKGDIVNIVYSQWRENAHACGTYDKVSVGDTVEVYGEMIPIFCVGTWITICGKSSYYLKKISSESHSINVWTDKSEYKIGETVKIYYQTNKKCTAKLTITKPDGGDVVYGPNEIPASTRSKSATAGYPIGKRTVVFEAWAGSEYKKATCYFDVVEEKKPKQPSPEIIKVEYPTACVKEDEYATISVTVANNGGASSEGYISVSFPNDEDVYVVSGTGNEYNKVYLKGSEIWGKDCKIPSSKDPLVELFDTNWGKYQQETITMKAKPNSGSDKIEFLVRAALKNDADGTYERDPTYSSYKDQQGWYVKKYSVDVCEYEKVKFGGKILVDNQIISFYSFDIKIDEVIDDPTGNLQKGETVNVYGHRDGPAHVDDVTVGDEVEVYGEYRGYVGTYEQIFLSDYGESSSDHYVKKIEEKPAPEIIKVTYPTTCVKESEDTTISVTVKNNGGASSEGYISVSFPNDEDVSVVSGTGNGYNKLYPKGSEIWGKDGKIPSSKDPLVELFDTNWVKDQQETITMNVKPNSGSDEIVFYVRAALKNADGSYERDPTYSGYKDQQGWYAERHVVEVCPKEACIIIDDDTCVGYEVWVDGAYKLTDGDGDGYCSFSVAEGTHTIEIRDNSRYAAITRNFEGTYTWNSMPDNWCKGDAKVEFKGTIVKDSSTSSFFNYKIKLNDVLTDPSEVLNPGDEIWVWAVSGGPSQVDSVGIDDKVEVYGTYDGESHREVKLETAEHTLKKDKYVSTTFTNTIGMEFVLIPAGEFEMGSPSDEAGRNSNEGPVHHVTLGYAFYMGRYEVTQQQWREIMGDNPSYFKGDDLPVELVSWDNAQNFIKKLNEKEGTDKYRLPSEAEWEYACRAGTTTRYSFGDDESKLGEYAWYLDNSGGKTHPVGQKKPNPWGLYDMHGNVWEWVQDCIGRPVGYNGAPTDGSAWVTSPDDPLSIRSGGWTGSTINCRSADRYWGSAASCTFGFRLVSSLPTTAEVKFRGVIVKESIQTSKITIDEILMDPSDVLNSGDEIWVFSSGPATVDDVSIGDKVEVYGKYDGELHREVKLETAEHYLKNLESQEEKKGRLTIEKIDLNTGCTPKDIKIPNSFGNLDLSDCVAHETLDRNPSVAKEGQIFYVTVKAKAHDSDLQKGQIYVVLVPPTEQTGVYCIERTQEPDKISKDELELWKFKVTCLKGKIEVKTLDPMDHFWKIGVLTTEPNIFAFRAFAFTAFQSDQSELRSIPVIALHDVDFREEITESLKNELINKVTENLYSLLEIESYTVAALDTLNDAWNKAIENDKIFEEAKEDSRKTFLKVKLEDLYANQQPGSCT